MQPEFKHQVLLWERGGGGGRMWMTGTSGCQTGRLIRRKQGGVWGWGWWRVREGERESSLQCHVIPVCGAVSAGSAYC